MLLNVSVFSVDETLLTALASITCFSFEKFTLFLTALRAKHFYLFQKSSDASYSFDAPS